jgi:HopJ type III effector protein
MTITSFLEKLKNTPESLEFADMISTVDANYDFTQTAFHNGDAYNEAGKNSGSCKLFSFAQMHHLTKEQTLACFGAYYRVYVLENPDGTDHQNIRNFIQYGWEGIAFEGEALVLK